MTSAVFGSFMTSAVFAQHFSDNRVPFVVTHNRTLPPIAKILRKHALAPTTAEPQHK